MRAAVGVAEEKEKTNSAYQQRGSIFMCPAVYRDPSGRCRGVVFYYQVTVRLADMCISTVARSDHIPETPAQSFRGGSSGDSTSFPGGGCSEVGAVPPSPLPWISIPDRH